MTTVVPGRYKGKEFCAVHPRLWKSLKVQDLRDCVYGKLTYDLVGAPSFLEVYNESVILGELQNVARFCAIVGNSQSVIGDYYGFENLYQNFFSNYNFSEEGVVSIENNDLLYTTGIVNEYFRCILRSGRKLVEKIEGIMKKIYGSQSSEHVEWKCFARDLYDNSLAYAFCYDLRNGIEHEDFMINPVNADLITGVVGFAINLENDICEMKLKGSLIRRLNSFSEDRERANKTPWISVAKILKAYHHAVVSLMLTFFDIQQRESKNCIEQDPDDFLKRNHNCIVKVISLSESRGYKEIIRVYPIVDDASISALEERVSQIKNNLLGEVDLG